MKKITILLSFLIISLTILVMPIFAQEPSFDEVNEVAKQLNCPTCQSLNLADCRTETCAQWRDQIKDFLAEGRTEQEILDWYATRYGDQVLQEPPRRGVGLYVWVLPIIALLAGTIWLGFLLKRWSSKQQPLAPAENMPTAQSGDTSEYLSKVEQDLKNF